MELGELLELKSRNRLDELGEYGTMMRNSPVSLSNSDVCRELIVPERPMKPGYLCSLSGTAVVRAWYTAQ
jgi:hypothetical protein